MGGSGSFLESGGFSRQDFVTKDLVDGVKVVKHITNPNSGLPLYSNTPHTTYLHEDSKGHINQMRFYRGRKPKYDIDWGHSHGNLPLGEPHIHVWVHHKDGSVERKPPRLLNSREKKVLDKLLNKIKTRR